jgi:hypothetical protein
MQVKPTVIFLMLNIQAGREERGEGKRRREKGGATGELRKRSFHILLEEMLVVTAFRGK